MKRILLLTATLTIMTACSNDAGTDDLTGTWKQTNSNDDESWMEAIIEDDTISVDWITEDGDSQSVYWVGTYEAPGEEVSGYTWTSERDAEATDAALLASTADTKDFNYEDGELYFELEMMGTTETIRMEIND